MVFLEWLASPAFPKKSAHDHEHEERKARRIVRELNQGTLPFYREDHPEGRRKRAQLIGEVGQEMKMRYGRTWLTIVYMGKVDGRDYWEVAPGQTTEEWRRKQMERHLIEAHGMGDVHHEIMGGAYGGASGGYSGGSRSGFPGIMSGGYLGSMGGRLPGGKTGSHSGGISSGTPTAPQMSMHSFLPSSNRHENLNNKQKGSRHQSSSVYPFNPPAKTTGATVSIGLFGKEDDPEANLRQLAEMSRMNKKGNKRR